MDFLDRFFSANRILRQGAGGTSAPRQIASAATSPATGATHISILKEAAYVAAGRWEHEFT
jgi:hypothetical protein